MEEEDLDDAIDEPKISIAEAQNYLDRFKVFALENARVSGRLMECTIELSSAFVDFRQRTERKQTKIFDFFVNKPVN